MKYASAVLLCLWLPASAQRSPLPQDRLEKVRGVLDAMYRLEFKVAETRARAMTAAWPGDPVGAVYLARVLWQELLVEERALTVHRFTQPDFFTETPRYRAAMDPAAEQRFRAASDEAIRAARLYAQKQPRSPAALYLLGVAYQNEASFQLTLKNAWFAAVRAGNLGHHAHRDLLALDSNYSDARLVTGIYNYTAGNLPWSIKWLALLLGYQGTKEKGAAELELAAAKGQLVADDARAVLAVLYSRDNRYDLALKKLEDLRARYPENYLTHLDIAGLEIRRGRPAAAVDLYKDALARIEAGKGSYARLERAIVYNQLGIACRAARNFAESERWLRRTLESGPASSRSRIQALLELGKTHDLAGRRQDALRQYRLAMQEPDYLGIRAEAGEYMNRPYRGQ